MGFRIKWWYTRGGGSPATPRASSDHPNGQGKVLGFTYNPRGQLVCIFLPDGCKQVTTIEAYEPGAYNQRSYEIEEVNDGQ
jgi:YD repeat-containing protein